MPIISLSNPKRKSKKVKRNTDLLDMINLEKKKKEKNPKNNSEIILKGCYYEKKLGSDSLKVKGIALISPSKRNCAISIRKAKEEAEIDALKNVLSEICHFAGKSISNINKFLRYTQGHLLKSGKFNYFDIDRYGKVVVEYQLMVDDLQYIYNIIIAL